MLIIVSSISVILVVLLSSILSSDSVFASHFFLYVPKAPDIAFYGVFMMPANIFHGIGAVSACIFESCRCFAISSAPILADTPFRLCIAASYVRISPRFLLSSNFFESARRFHPNTFQATFYIILCCFLYRKVLFPYQFRVLYPVKYFSVFHTIPHILFLFYRVFLKNGLAIIHRNKAVANPCTTSNGNPVTYAAIIILILTAGCHMITDAGFIIPPYITILQNPPNTQSPSFVTIRVLT